MMQPVVKLANPSSTMTIKNIHTYVVVFIKFSFYVTKGILLLYLRHLSKAAVKADLMLLKTSSGDREASIALCSPCAL